MVVLSFCYKREIPFDEAYYFDVHLPQHSRHTVLSMGAAKYEVRRVLSSAAGCRIPYPVLYYFRFVFRVESRFGCIYPGPQN